MSRRWKIAGAVVAVLLVTAAGAFVALDRASYGIARFYVWRSLSGEFRGSHRANVDGISLYYEVYGSGPPVLVLHGALGFLETMHPFITALAPTHMVIAVDSRAQGRSTDSAAPITYALMGHDMIALLDVLHLRRVDVVGWSDGGNDGLDMAMKHPDRVRRLIAIGANYDANGVDPKSINPDFERDITQGVRPFYERIAPDPSYFPVMYRKVMTMVRTEPHYTEAELGHIRARTFIIAGEHDMILAEHTAKLAAAIPGAKKIIVPGASHFGPLEKPDLYGRMVVDLLNAP